MLRVRVYPDTNVHHVLQIYAGLYDLKTEGKIDLKFTRHFPEGVRSYMPYTLWLEAEDLTTGEGRRICFDMVDGDVIASMDGLEKCDVYFKRSYNKRVIKKLRNDLGRKIFPYGLCYSLLSNNETNTISRLFLEFLCLCSDRNDNSGDFIQFFKRAFKIMQSKYKMQLFDESLIGYSTEFEIPPTEGAEPTILFQTRAWSPSACSHVMELDKLRELNDFRAGTVRNLRREFPDRFIGGIMPTDFAKRYYPDCLTNLSVSRQSYIALVKRSLITVTTMGLSESTGFKLPEYLAASRCIISEPLIYDLPVSLESYKHYIPFRTPEECVRACAMIIENPEFAAEMRMNNYDYYLKEVRPSSLVENCLKKAFFN